jgi:aryl-alcohol dehydrogenase-like predicted oxidoreductase
MHPKIALGTYRMTDLNPEHIQAIVDAIEAGTVLIDTAPNYMNGAAERAVAKALQQIDESLRHNVEIISKFGYIQGDTLDQIKSASRTYDDMVEFSEHVFYSLHPDFIRDELNNTLERLQTKTLSCYMIQNPEYLLLNAIKMGQSHTEALETTNQQIYRAFVTLETLVEEEKIQSYGISSNSFAKASDDEEFLAYEDLITLAVNAAKEVGNTKHGLTTVQLPINLLEREGLKCASWAKAQGLRVLANRPLNAQIGNQMYRLADYEEPAEYFNRYNELLGLLDHQSLKPIYNIIEQLDGNKHRFSWIGEYEQFLHQQVVPHLQRSLAPLDQESAETLAYHLHLFLEVFAKMVAYECSKRSRVLLKPYTEGCQQTLQSCALHFLFQQNMIDNVLVGMRKSRYVADVMNIA